MSAIVRPITCAPAEIDPPRPNRTPSCLANSSANRSSDGTSIRRVMTDIGGELTLASSLASSGVLPAWRDALTAMCELFMVSASSRAANVAGE